jgi:hypothetical protein
MESSAKYQLPNWAQILQRILIGPFGKVISNVKSSVNNNSAENIGRVHSSSQLRYYSPRAFKNESDIQSEHQPMRVDEGGDSTKYSRPRGTDLLPPKDETFSHSCDRPFLLFFRHVEIVDICFFSAGPPGPSGGHGDDRGAGTSDGHGEGSDNCSHW